MTAIPLIGVVVGGVPALLLAFGSSSWIVGATMLVLLLTLQAVEMIVVRPLVDSRSVRVGTTVAVVVTLVAFDLYGIGAAMCAFALAAIALAALDVYGASRDEELIGLDRVACAREAHVAGRLRRRHRRWCGDRHWLCR